MKKERLDSYKHRMHEALEGLVSQYHKAFLYKFCKFDTGEYINKVVTPLLNEIDGRENEA